MAARPSTHRQECAEKGCREAMHCRFDTLRERREWFDRNRGRTYRCERHRCPDMVVTPDNPVVTTELVAVECFRDVPVYRGAGWNAQRTGGTERRSNGVRWKLAGREDDEQARASSHVYCWEAFRAFAEAWPPGTRLRITVYAETPEQAEQTADAL